MFSLIHFFVFLVSFKFYKSLFLGAQMKCQHRFKKWLGTDQAICHDLKKIMIQFSDRNMCHPGSMSQHSHLIRPHSNTNLGQHWLRQWFIARSHKAITWTNVDLSSKVFCGIHLRAISQELHPKDNYTFKIVYCYHIWYSLVSNSRTYRNRRTLGRNCWKSNSGTPDLHYIYCNK